MDDINYNVQKTYTEEEVFQLFQRFRNEEKLASSKDRDERPLPVEILTHWKRIRDISYKKHSRDIKKISADTQMTIGQEQKRSTNPCSP